MKHEIKTMHPYDIAMIGNLFPLTESKVYDIMLDKGDIEFPEVPSACTASYEVPKGKSMRAADRRKKTFHKHEQREKQYKNLGYHVEHLSASERGKLREGVGTFPEGQHMNSMYNRNSCEGGMRGNRKEIKHFSIKKVVEQVEHDEWIASRSAELEHDLYDLHNCIGSCDVDIDMYEHMLYDLEHEVEDIKDYLSELLYRVSDLKNSIERTKYSKKRLLYFIESAQRSLDSLQNL